MDIKIEDLGIKDLKVIYLAGGCFWGVEGYFKELNGVLEVEVGYANGKTAEATYENLDLSGHAETLKLTFDKNKISLVEIFDHYYRIIDPFSINKQMNDVGTQYRTGIYSEDEDDVDLARKFLDEKQKKEHRRIVVETKLLENYTRAEDYHQDYLGKNPRGYCHVDLTKVEDPLYGNYGRTDPSRLKETLSEEAYQISQENMTEKPFSSDYNDNDRPGIYVDITNGEPLFASQDKYDAGCGWPSFTRPINSYVIDYKDDRSHGMTRIEVRSKEGDSHLGHVFEDGPATSGGLRYCINGAVLEFVPYEEMDQRGYEDYKKYVEVKK